MSNKLQEIWKDTITEDELIEKTGYKPRSLERFRREGKLKYATATGHKKLYSLKQVIEFLGINHLQ